MLTAALAGGCVLLLIAAGTFALLWRAAALDAARYRAEFCGISDLVPPAATAALTPDDPSLLPAEIEQWLRERTN